MALAILELLELDNAHARFKLDIGTNRYFQLKVGSSVQQRYGLDWVDEIVYATPITASTARGGLLNSSQQVSLPASRFDQGNAYVQLFSFKTAAGRSPAFSQVLKTPRGLHLPSKRLRSLTSPQSMTSMLPVFVPPRKIPCCSVAEKWSQQASLEDLLSAIVKVAMPIVTGLLGSGAPAKDGTGASANVLATLLKSILGGSVPGLNLSQPQSLVDPRTDGNRFLNGHGHENGPAHAWSHPFIFGIDDALIGALIGPVLQVLPQLVTAANQKRLQLKQEDNKLIGGILSDVNKRVLLQQLLNAQQQRPASDQSGSQPDLESLVQLLQGASADSAATTTAPVPPPAPGPVPSTVKSLSTPFTTAALSRTAVLSFIAADPIEWNSTPHLLFARTQPVQFRVQLNVGEPAPKTALPKAILRLTFKEPTSQTVLFEKTFKLKEISPNAPIPLALSPAELSSIPAQKPVAVLAEFRWLNSKSGQEYKAVGSSEIVMVNKYFLADAQGKEGGPEQELTDMNRFRPFWNKIWEAPVLDAATPNRDDQKKYLWELDANAKYSVLLTPDHPSNGFMETKVLRGDSTASDLTDKTEGRMKAGVELSVAELNKLLPLWDNSPVLSPEQLEAFQTGEFARRNASEFIYRFKLKGSAGQRGMVWVVPIFKLSEFATKTIQETDEFGQIVAAGEEKIRFPLPIAGRALGLKSQT